MESKFAFGCMRLPMNGEEVDYEQFNRMIDTYMEAGFNYFDTAHGYLKGKSELAIRDCLASRYPRESYVLTNKLTGTFFKTKEDIRPLFEEQLKCCGVDYFDYYLMHAQDQAHYAHFTKCAAYEVAQELKKEGKVKHVGISFHDTADVLEKILIEHPEIEIVQIQFNYADYKDSSVQSKQCYEICRKYNKPILIMEPVKGGALANLPPQAQAILDTLNQEGSQASYAMRFAASFEGVYKVLSGMSTYEQLLDNMSYMKDFKPMTSEEFEACDKIADILHAQGGIACTACRYCTDGCPMHISIPDLFACYNAKKQFNDWNSDMYYNIHTRDGNTASKCIGCKQCERVCPQHLTIVDYLKEVSKIFDQKEG